MNDVENNIECFLMLSMVEHNTLGQRTIHGYSIGTGCILKCDNLGTGCIFGFKAVWDRVRFSRSQRRTRTHIQGECPSRVLAHAGGGTFCQTHFICVVLPGLTKLFCQLSPSVSPAPL